MSSFSYLRHSMSGVNCVTCYTHSMTFMLLSLCACDVAYVIQWTYSGSGAVVNECNE